MYVYVCVCLYVCVCAFMYVCVYTLSGPQWYVVCVCVYVYVCMCVVCVSCVFVLFGVMCVCVLICDSSGVVHIPVGLGGRRRTARQYRANFQGPL